MTDEQINIAVAEVCGFLCPRYSNGVLVAYAHAFPDGGFFGTTGVPDYINDLNAMHEAEKIFDHALYCRYINELCDITIKGNNSMYMATARQRAEAFLKTLNKWEGTPIE
jgi:hypothetical protein